MNIVGPMLVATYIYLPVYYHGGRVDHFHVLRVATCDVLRLQTGLYQRVTTCDGIHD